VLVTGVLPHLDERWGGWGGIIPHLYRYKADLKKNQKKIFENNFSWSGFLRKRFFNLM
jgi:hypothetical protein